MSMRRSALDRAASVRNRALPHQVGARGGTGATDYSPRWSGECSEHAHRCCHWRHGRWFVEWPLVELVILFLQRRTDVRAAYGEQVVGTFRTTWQKSSGVVGAGHVDVSPWVLNSSWLRHRWISSPQRYRDLHCNRCAGPEGALNIPGVTAVAVVVACFGEFERCSRQFPFIPPGGGVGGISACK